MFTAIQPAKFAMFRSVIIAFISVAFSSPAAQAMEFNLNPSFDITTPTGALAYGGFQNAASRWSALFKDPITINLDIGFQDLGNAGIIGSTNAVESNYSYGSVATALSLDATSANDFIATTHLPTGSTPGTFDLLMNRTSDNPNGAGSELLFIDATGGFNNSSVYIANANAKALGLLAGTTPGSDATVTFNSTFSFDYDSSNGIAPGKIDFLGVAIHEIGHALGFLSGVDILDGNSPQGATYFPSGVFSFVTPLDLFRYSAISTAEGTIDWSADNRAKYFSIDGGATSLAGFSTGLIHGDGRQASHWKDNLALGILDPTLSFGELAIITPTDVRGFDVIGYDLVAVPELATRLTYGLGTLLGLAALHRRRRSRQPC